MDNGAVIGARLRQVREAAGLSLSALAARIPFSKTALQYYETGERDATPDVISCYERVCGPFADPVTTVETLGRADVDRRSFLRKATYSAALSATGLVALSDVARLIRVTDSRQVGMPEIVAVQSVTDAFIKLDEARGGAVGRTAVAEFLATDVSAMLRARFPDDKTRTHAYSAAAELAYLAGFKAHDAGDDGVAQRYFLGALRLAEESKMPGQDGFVFRILALQGTDIRQQKFSVDLAEESERRATGRVGPDAQALFTVAVARCHAESGNKPQAIAALRRAEPYINADMTSEQPRWISLWCPNKATVVDQTAKTLLAAGELPAAEQHYGLGTSIWSPETHARVYALTAAETGLIRWRMGDHTGAVSMWKPAVPILSAVNSARTTKVLTKIRKAAPQAFSPAGELLSA
ncbi:helix-turn-helix domain-containing protein [Nocardia brasiliensis]|uniref:helix-turn-helix domain-containing protein n=1 Tax=Nocardia brasiliensis TaxID=37326 RepID=UPI0024588704|nr:helix-turn-helix transcriptional regulator [Nocardia brasiliensis]